MHATPSGPDFERSPDQKVVPGDYHEPESPRLPPPPTLLGRLRSAIRKPSSGRRGPGFRKPKGWRQWTDTAHRAGGDTTSSQRPTGYNAPGADGDTAAS
ncbi:hypothetical protein [Tessaracoccus antarcticus]|uniref:hypothetical protein n=1 Tax=Tessaracoccus antarcticus TaxID=2479848 RepID=UPI0011C3B983|nr:hypothetical protein [Tessaracoccus antarcticus]